MFARMLCTALMSITLTVGFAQAGVIMRHEGAIDPETEGWSKKANWTNLATGPIYDDQGQGVDAWMIQDNSGVGEYTAHISWTPEVEAADWENGWIARWELRVAATPDPITDWTPYIGIGFDDDVYDARFVMTLGADVSGNNTLIKVSNAAVEAEYMAPITVAGLGYHLFELVFDPATKTVDLFADGTEIASDLVHRQNPSPPSEYVGVMFGSRHTAASSTTHYSLVEFEVVPEPGMVALLVGVLAMLGFYRCR